MKPTDIPSVEERESGRYFCSMCTSSFDTEAFEIADEQCPGCKAMSEAEDRMPGPGAL